MSKASSHHAERVKRMKAEYERAMRAWIEAAAAYGPDSGDADARDAIVEFTQNELDAMGIGIEWPKGADAPTYQE